MLVTLNRGGGVAIVSPDSTQTSLTIYTQKATVAWLAMAEWSGLPFWLRLVESVVPFPVRSHKVKRRADELQQETEEHGSSTAYDDRVHRVPKQGLAVAPQTGPFRVDAANSSNPVVCSKGGSKHLTELDILWGELSSKDISTDVKLQKRL